MSSPDSSDIIPDPIQSIQPAKEVGFAKSQPTYKYLKTDAVQSIRVLFRYLCGAVSAQTLYRLNARLYKYIVYFGVLMTQAIL